MKVEFTEEEIRERKPETIRKLAEFIQLCLQNEKARLEKEFVEEEDKLRNPCEVKIRVVENLSMGEKLGG